MLDSIDIPSIPNRPNKTKNDMEDATLLYAKDGEINVEGENVDLLESQDNDLPIIPTRPGGRKSNVEETTHLPIIPQRPSRNTTQESMEPKVPELPGKVLDDDQPIVPQRQAQDFTEIHEPIIPSRPRKLPVLVNLDEDRIEENSKDINDYSLVSADSFQPMATQRPVEDITESHEEIIPLRLTKLPELGNTDEDRIELNAKDINDDSFHPIIPTRPSRTSTSTNSSPIPQIPIRPLKKQSPGLTTSAPILDDEKKLNSEKLEGDIEGDGDLTPGNTDTKTTFKTFEEEPASDSSSFNDDVETVQDKEEVEESANDLSEGQHAEIGSSGSQVNEDHTQVCEAGQEEEIPIESIPTVPKRLVKNVETDSIANDSDESKPRAPPPKPKKLSSKIAAFQEMFNNQAPVFLKPSAVAPTFNSSESSTPSIPKRPSKLSSDKIKFGNSLHGIMGRGIAMPGMVAPTMLQSSHEEKPEECNDAQNVEDEDDQKPVVADVRKGRAKGPKGKRLPKSLKETTVETSSKFNMIIEDLWEISHLKTVETENDDNLPEQVTSDVSNTAPEKVILKELNESDELDKRVEGDEEEEEEEVNSNVVEVEAREDTDTDKGEKSEVIELQLLDCPSSKQIESHEESEARTELDADVDTERNTIVDDVIEHHEEEVDETVHIGSELEPSKIDLDENNADTNVVKLQIESTAESDL